MSSGLRFLALALVVVLAGCTLGVGDTDPVAPTAESPDGFTSLENHSLDIDPDRTFERTARLVGEDVQRPPVNVIEQSNVPSVGSAAGGPAFMREAFVSHHGIDDRGQSTGTAAGLTDGLGNVYLVNGSGSPTVMEQILVHEFAHTIQFRGGMLQWQTPRSGAATTDAYLTRMALVEGGAVYVADAYTREHLNGVPVQSARMSTAYAEGRTGDRFMFAPYALGADYFQGQLSEPDQFQTLYAHPPATTTHVLHNYSAERSVTRPLPVTAAGGADWTPDPSGPNTVGELTTRIVLAGTLDDGRARRAATGWQNDTVVTFEGNDRPDGVVWVLRMNDGANATNLARAARTYADRRPDSRTAYRVERVDDTAVAVVSGPDTFVERAWVGGSADGVRVSVSETSGTESPDSPDAIELTVTAPVAT